MRLQHTLRVPSRCHSREGTGMLPIHATNRSAPGPSRGISFHRDQQPVGVLLLSSGTVVTRTTAADGACSGTSTHGDTCEEFGDRPTCGSYTGCVWDWHNATAAEEELPEGTVSMGTLHFIPAGKTADHASSGIVFTKTFMTLLKGILKKN